MKNTIKPMTFVRAVDWAKYAVAGAICGLGVINAGAAFMGSVTTDGAEKAGMIAGAIIVASLVKALHIV